MPRTNDQVEAALLEFADLLSIVSGDPFKPRAYEKAARAVGGYPDDVGDLDAKGVLAIPGVGKSIAAKITDYLGSGHLPRAGGAPGTGARRRPGDDGDPGVRSQEGDDRSTRSSGSAPSTSCWRRPTQASSRR